ncbi:MAG: uroporphyrinogen-III C-methyltransferase [Acidimicrobiales bacterium]
MTVYLVGAGPGDPALVTVRGAELLARADAVVHDRLVHRELLALVPAAAEVHDVGKRPGDRVEQGAIDALLVRLGRRYRGGTVVRLKGGDPFVFGRGGEEALALRAAGLGYEVVPGVSAPNGVLGYAGIPLTHRGESAGFAVVTGHGAGGGPAAVDWEALARLEITVVVLMGVEHRAELSARLLAGGRPASTPVAIVENGTLPAQTVTRTTLDNLAAVAAGSPATIVVGSVAALDLAWFAGRPLTGWTVAVTRAKGQAPALSEALRQAGATAVEIPMISLVEPSDGGRALRDAIGRLDSYDWVVFTSRNTVERVWREVRDARAFGRVRVACIGTATAAALAERGIVPDLVPDSFVSEALAAAFPPAAAGGQRVLLPQASVARQVLSEELAAKGYIVEVAEAYQVVRADPEPDLVAAARRADAVMLASASSAVGWADVMGSGDAPALACCIGPVTAAAARAAGIGVSMEAAEHTISGLVQALCEYASVHGRPAQG